MTTQLTPDVKPTVEARTDTRVEQRHDIDVEPRRDIRSRSVDDRLRAPGAAISAVALVWMIFTYVLPWSGLVGFAVCWLAVFLMLIAALTALTNPRPVVIDRLMAATVTAGATLIGVALASAVIYTFWRGFSALVHVSFLTQDMLGTRPNDPLLRGGILHAIVGSIIEMGIAVLITVPLGIGAAVYMAEVGGRFSYVVRTVVEAMTALPSIVAGLFIYTVLIIGLGFNRSGFAAAMAISVMILPIIARGSDIALRIVPHGLREASLSLGASQWQTVWRVVLPTARPGLTTAVILGIARGVGETSPVLLTSGASTFLTFDPTAGSMNSLPLYVFAAVRSGQTLNILRGFGAASVLLMLVLVLFVIMRRLVRQQSSQ
jgi:phosphate transport system permease protein